VYLAIGTSKFYELNNMEKPQGWDEEGKKE
jgi:hypothetical protein